MVKIENAEKYFNCIKKISFHGMEQTEFWYHYKKETKNFVFYVDSVVDTSIGIMGTLYKKPIIGNILQVIDGPVYKENTNQKKIVNFFNELKKEYSIIEIDSSNIYDVNFEVSIRRAGFKRPLMYKRCPLTIYIDLNDIKRYDRNWRRNIIKAKENGLIFFEAEKNKKHLAVFVEMFNEMRQLKNISYGINTEELQRLLSCEEIHLFLVKKEEDILAGRIVAIRGSFAYDVHASNSNRARDFGATFFLIDNILTYLKNKNVLYFDFGRISPGIDKKDNVTLFKEGSNGKYIQYNGEWGWYKRTFYQYAMYFYQKVFLKIKGY